MDRDLWKRVKQVAAEAWERPAPLRREAVVQACGGDDALRDEVLALLEAMEQVGDRFEDPIVGDASRWSAASHAIEHAAVDVSGQRIGPWRLIREIGRGGMGTVYFAERVDAEFDQRVAIKLVRAWSADDRVLARFREERRILATLEHPNIARLIDGGTNDNGLPYVVMEYVEGVPIDVYCAQSGLDVRQRVEVFRRVCAAVQYAHQHLIVHRDIKPSNILVTADGTPKLLDFGIAKMLEDGAAADSTRTLFRMVTPESASPEQLKGEPITTVSDVYALGTLLYRLLTGRGPYRAAPGSDTEIVRAVCEEIPPPPSVVVQSIDVDLDRIVLKALRKEPERRYHTADQLSEDLQRFLTGRPVLAAPDRPAYRARKFLERHRVAVMGALAVAVVLAAGVGATMWQMRVAQRERLRAERQFNAVRSLANSVLGELYDTVNRLPGSLTARELLTRRATEYLDTLASEGPGNAALRRELATGYNRLGQLQGAGGLPNLGDRDAARRTYLKAEALFESIDPAALDADGTIGLAESHLRLADFESDDDRVESRLARARALLDGLKSRGEPSPRMLLLETAIWERIGNRHEGRKEYAGAKVSFAKAVTSAEMLLRVRPESLDASRNLSLGYKKLGTESEMLDQPDEALDWYGKALALDRARVAAGKAGSLGRLDLSFSLAAIANVMQDRNDFAAAVASYREAVDIRRDVVAADPQDEFAVNALIRGYERLGRTLGRGGQVDEAVEAYAQRVAASRAWLKAHADRAQWWTQHAGVLADSIGQSLQLVEADPRRGPTRANLGRGIQTLLTELVDLRSTWVRDKRAGAPPPSDEELVRLTDRTRRLSAGAPRS